jgi:hypothetical protein
MFRLRNVGNRRQSDVVALFMYEHWLEDSRGRR